MSKSLMQVLEAMHNARPCDRSDFLLSLKAYKQLEKRMHLHGGDCCSANRDTCCGAADKQHKHKHSKKSSSSCSSSSAADCCDQGAQCCKVTGKQCSAKKPNPSSSSSPPAFVNQYAGHKLTQSGPIDIVNIDDISAESLYNNYVAKRKPVLIRGFPTDWKGDKWTDFDYLRSKAGEAPLMVEVRDDTHDHYGQGREIKMSFTQLLDTLQKGSELLYLTTQNVGTDEAGRPNLFGEPLGRLLSDFPLRPSIMPTLVPFNYNLWMGNSKEGSTTGLHHDFHDNIYILMRGQKRFRIYSPNEIENIPVVGPLVRVHPNGRFNYDKLLTRDDGADEAGANADDEEAAAAAALEEAEKAVKEGKPGAKKLLQAAEERMEAALDQVLEAEMIGADDEDDEDDEEEEEGGGKKKKRKQKGGEKKKEKKIPMNFCKVDLEKPREETLKEFPKFANAVQGVAEINAGEMLYLPAGWFHEVTSSGEHIAFNYWFHPPALGAPFERPYQSQYWERSYAQCVASLPKGDVAEGQKVKQTPQKKPQQQQQQQSSKKQKK